MKKKSLVILAVVLVLVLSLALAACGGGLQAPPVNLDAIEFTRDANLSSIKLPEGFTWSNPKQPIKVGNNLYDAVYKKGKESVNVKLALEMKLTKSMLDEEVSMDYIEDLLNSADFKKGGAKYATSEYDQYVMILARSARGIKKSIKDAYLARVKDVVIPLVDKTTNIAIQSEPYTNYTDNVVPTLIAMDESTVVSDIDLAVPFRNKDYVEQDNFGSYTYAMLTVKNLKLGENYVTADGVSHKTTTTVDGLIEYMLSKVGGEGGWYGADYATGESTFMIDTTTNAIIALAEYYDRPAVKTAIDNAMKVLNTKILPSGALDNWGDNIDTTASYITALSALNIDASTVKNADKTKSLIDYVASQRINDGEGKGAYVYAAIDPNMPNFFATKDATISLINYNRMLKGYDSFYDIAVK